MLDWTRYLVADEESSDMSFREEGLPHDLPTLHEGIGFLREDAATIPFDMPNTLSAGRLTVVLGMVLTRHDDGIRAWHMAGEGLPAELLDVMTLFGWATATQCLFHEMQPCWCLPEKAKTPAANDQLERLVGMLHEAMPVYKEWKKFSDNLHRANIYLPASVFAAVNSMLKKCPE